MPDIHLIFPPIHRIPLRIFTDISFSTSGCALNKGMNVFENPTPTTPIQSFITITYLPLCLYNKYYITFIKRNRQSSLSVNEAAEFACAFLLFIICY